MDVVNEDRRVGAREQPSAERHAVLHLEDAVYYAKGTEPTSEHVERCPQVDGQMAAAADVADAVADLGAGRTGVAGGEDRDAVSALSSRVATSRT